MEEREEVVKRVVELGGARVRSEVGGGRGWGRVGGLVELPGLSQCRRGRGEERENISRVGYSSIYLF